MDVVNANEVRLGLLWPIVDAAKVSVVHSKLPNWKQLRWLNAISKAVEAIEENPRYQFQNGALILLSETSQKIYEVRANGSHVGCGAYERKQACYHVALRRLLELYAMAVALPNEADTHKPRVILDGIQPRSSFELAANAPLQRKTVRGDSYAGMDI